VCSELDGTAAHSADEQWRDKRRDNANAVRGIVTLRFGLLDLGDRRCQTAADVAAVLRLRGWTGVARPCPRPACALRDPVSRERGVRGWEGPRWVGREVARKREGMVG
jgi:hypothetical protein